MKAYPNVLLLMLILFFSCSKPTAISVDEVLAEDKVKVAQDSILEYTQADQENIQRLIQLTLLDQFKEDVDLGIIDSLSRTYKYNQIDLNGDGDLEILVGMTGPYFCGSGGCTVLLITHHGDVITRFSVVKYPAYLDEESSSGWRNLILYSGGANRVAQFGGQTYPSNPSTLPIYKGVVENLPKLLDWEAQESFRF